jgi:hypothetical protein
MKSLAFGFAVVALGLSLHASVTNWPCEYPAPGSAIMMTDGLSVFPTNSAATPTQLRSTEQRLSDTEARISSLVIVATGGMAKASEAYDTVRFLTTPALVATRGFIASVGARESAGTNQTVRAHSLTTGPTNIVIIGTFNKLQSVYSPSINMRYQLNTGSWASLSNVVCSWPNTVSDATVTDGWFAYSFTFARPTNAASAFFQVRSNDVGGSGSGLYMLFYNGVSVNGRNGRTVTVTASDNTQLTFVGGVLVDPLGE